MAIINATVADNGHLILVQEDGSTIDAGYVRGIPGPQGERGVGVKGDPGEPGPTGTGVGTTLIQNSITLGATTTAPTGGSRTVQRIEYQTVGDGMWLTYKLGMTGATVGAGDYLLSLPTGVSFNTTNNPVFTGALWTGGVAAMAPYFIPTMGGITIPGWWSNMIGPGKGFDTDKYFVICSNVVGGCRGTTGPGSINAATGCPWGLTFPSITIGDMVRLQKMLIDHLGISRLLAVAGGSMGGMQALEWAVTYPDHVLAALPIATTTRHSAQQIAFNEVGRQAIMADPDWNGGDYYGKRLPARGLSVARMVGHITYMSDESMRQKFGRRLREGQNKFEVESYLHYRGAQFVDRFDANSYIYITRAMDMYDLTQRGSLPSLFEKVRTRFLVLSFTSDWLYPSYQSLEIVSALRSRNCDVAYCNLDRKSTRLNSSH